MGSCTFAGGGALHRRRKICSVKFLTFACNYHPLHHWRRCRNWKGTASVAHDVASFLSHQFPATWLYYCLAFEAYDFSLESGFCLYGQYAHYPLDISPDLFPIQSLENHLAVENL